MTMTRLLTGIGMLCLGFASSPAMAEPGLSFDRDAVVEAADWGAMQTVRVLMREHEYEPYELRFEPGQAYRLELVNEGQEKHYFTAPEFFRAIATRKVQSNRDGEIKAPYFLALEIMPGGQLDLYFVPVEAGEFALYCTIDDHREQVMEGVLVVGG